MKYAEQIKIGAELRSYNTRLYNCDAAVAGTIGVDLMFCDTYQVFTHVEAVRSIKACAIDSLCCYILVYVPIAGDSYRLKICWYRCFACGVPALGLELKNDRLTTVPVSVKALISRQGLIGTEYGS